jgi:hypothetical protein
VKSDGSFLSGYNTDCYFIFRGIFQSRKKITENTIRVIKGREIIVVMRGQIFYEMIRAVPGPLA